GRSDLDDDGPVPAEPGDRVATPGRVRRVARTVLIAVAAMLALVGASFAGAELATRTASAASVPDLLGVDRDHAAGRLRAAGLRLGTVHHEHNDAPAGTVYTSDPRGGGVLARGAPVDVWISDGPGSVAVPDDLIGKSKDEAIQALDDLGLTVHVTYRPSTAPADGVLDSDPSPGDDADAGGQVELYVSCGHTRSCP